MSSIPLYVTIDMKDVDVALGSGIIPTDQLDFGHRIAYFLNSSSLNQYNKLRIYLKCKRCVVEVSPMLKVPSLLSDFIDLLKDCLDEKEVRVGKIRVLTLKKEMPSLPGKVYSVHPTAQKVLNPSAITGEQCVIEFSKNPDELGGSHVCFSRYPLDPIAQCANIVSAFEAHFSIQ